MDRKSYSCVSQKSWFLNKKENQNDENITIQNYLTI